MYVLAAFVLTRLDVLLMGGIVDVQWLIINYILLIGDNVDVQKLIVDLEPNTLYRIRVAGATKSIDLSSDHYYVGPYSDAKEIKTLRK